MEVFNNGLHCKNNIAVFTYLLYIYISIHETYKHYPQFSVWSFLVSIFIFYYQTTACSSAANDLDSFKENFCTRDLKKCTVCLFGLLILAKEEFVEMHYALPPDLKCFTVLIIIICTQLFDS